MAPVIFCSREIRATSSRGDALLTLVGAEGGSQALQSSEVYQEPRDSQRPQIPSL